MLEKVLILIERERLPKLQSLCEDLRRRTVGVAIETYNAKSDGTGKKHDADGPLQKVTADSLPKLSAPKENVLYITDSEAGYYVLRQQGRYVLPYRHEGNSHVGFTGALYVIEQIEEIGFETVDMVYRRLAGVPWDILTTKRCMIRETIVEDVDHFYAIYASPGITEYMEGLYADRAEEIAYVEEYRKSVYSFYGYGMWTVLTKEGQVIGRAGVSWRDGFDLPELGFVIGEPWQRQGYAYEVCSAILAYAQEELGFMQIQALVMEGNEKSAALCRKLGFVQNGRTLLQGCAYVVYNLSFTKGK